MGNPIRKIDKTIYTPTVSRMVFTLPEARAEYSALRKIAAKRLQRLAKSGAGASTYERYKDSFMPLPRTASEATVRKQLYSVASFLTLKSSTVSGAKDIRERQIETLHEMGYDYINDANLDQFGQYMDRVRSYASSKLYDSEEIIDLFRDATEKGVDPMLLADDFGDYIEAGIPDDMIPDLDEEDEDALEEMRGSDVIPEPLPGEKEEPEKKTRRKKTPQAKRAAKNKKRAEKNKRARGRQRSSRQGRRK